MSDFAWVTLATNDSYSLGALVLAHSLKRANTVHQLAILITPGVTEAMRTQLSAVYNVVQVVDVLDSRDEANLTLLARPELGVTFTKLHCWRLTQFKKCVFLDADTLVLQNCDELFEREELSAAPDAGWPDCFNSGVYVFQPSNATFKQLMEFAVVHGSFDGGDQGLLNLYFKDWATKDIHKHLPFVYNMCSTATYSYLPAFKQFGSNLKIIHFIGSSKPWLQVFDTETGLVRVSGESHSIGSFVQLWWDLFCAHVHTSLSTEMSGLAAALATVTIGAPLSSEQTVLQEHMRRQGWEQGNIDYMGQDSFDNIWRKISETITAVDASEPADIEQSSSDVLPQSPSKTILSPPAVPSTPVPDPSETLVQASAEVSPTKKIVPPPKVPTPVIPSTQPSPVKPAPDSPTTTKLPETSQKPFKPIQKLPSSDLTPPSSPSTAEPIVKLIQPSTPIVTSPTPPTSPPIDPFGTHSEKLKVDPETPDTPPAASTDEPPVPPKRKGTKLAQEQTSKTQAKPVKPVKGKK